MIRNCPTCKQDFEMDSLRKYCSAQCKLMAKGKAICPVCKVEFQRKSYVHIYCSKKCQDMGMCEKFGSVQVRGQKARAKTYYKLTEHFTQEQWDTLCDLSGYKCLCCGRTDVKLIIDHVIPLKRYGKNTIDNIQPLCQDCNLRKGQSVIDYRPKSLIDELRLPGLTKPKEKSHPPVKVSIEKATRWVRITLTLSARVGSVTIAKDHYWDKDLSSKPATINWTDGYQKLPEVVEEFSNLLMVAFRIAQDLDYYIKTSDDMERARIRKIDDSPFVLVDIERRGFNPQITDLLSLDNGHETEATNDPAL